jgi:hypothetical protein
VGQRVTEKKKKKKKRKKKKVEILKLEGNLNFHEIIFNKMDGPRHKENFSNNMALSVRTSNRFLIIGPLRRS